MKLLSLMLALAPLAVSSAAMAAPGNSNTIAGTANASVVQPIVLAHNPGSMLNFGKIAISGAGTVTVTPGSAGSTGGGASFVPGSTEAADWFYVTADPNRVFNITSSPGTISNGARTISFTTVPAVPSYSIPAGYMLYFAVGGTLSLTGTEPGGVYNGSYNVTVTYQ